MVIEEQAYDPLSHAQKHVMLKNGVFEFDDIPNGKCLCGHSISEHLDYIDCCLFVKGKEICICDRFLDKGHKITIPKSNGKLVHKKEVLQKPVQPEDPRLNSYVQTLSRCDGL